ncbi:MAG TPA: HepT-like ribonuclease domain-containing protein [Caulobacterales bacterium]|jgi:uncharacterized protein with HEPN domain|nr:HepT-like ribonuclease domain-containing protein [Caulobacterales bacterium]
MPAPRDERHRLLDILASIHLIRERLAGETLATLTRNLEKLDSIERRLEIISEASRHIPAPMQDLHPEIPWRGVADFGNILRHAYDGVEYERLWRVLQDELEPLRLAILDLYERLRRPGDPNPP